MEKLIAVLIIVYVLYIKHRGNKEQKKRLLLTQKSKAFSEYEISLLSSIKGSLDQMVENDYFQKAKELGHSDAEAAAFWKEFSKYKHDNRFLKNLSKVRAKYVR